MRFEIEGLPQDKKQILDTLLSKIEMGYANDISIVACYGSYITGTSNAKSDLDFYFIPKTDRGNEMSYQFIIDGIGYDLWPLTWERAESIIRLDNHLISIIDNAKPVYCSDELELARFANVKECLSENLKDKGIFSRKASDSIKNAKAMFGDLYNCKDDYAELKAMSINILEEVMRTIAFENETYVRKGFTNLKNELKNMKNIPNNFIDATWKIIKSNTKEEMINSIAILLGDVEQVNMTKKEKSRELTEPTADTLKGFYEEIKSTYNKMLIACDEKDYLKTYFITNTLDKDTKYYFGTRYNEFPVLQRDSEVDFEKLKELSISHEQTMRKILGEFNIRINEYRNVDEFMNDITQSYEEEKE